MIFPPGSWITRWFLRLVIPFVLVVDDQFARRFGEGATISRVILHWCWRHPLLPYALALGAGVLFGHLCCPVKPAPMSTPHYVKWAAVWILGTWAGHTLLPQHPAF